MSQSKALTCPRCHAQAVMVFPLQAPDAAWFAKITCLRCGEEAFFQVDSYEKAGEGGSSLQKEWEEWVALKKRHLEPLQDKGSGSSFAVNLFLFCFLLLGLGFFLADYYHLRGVVLENRKARQQVIHDYVARLAQLPCFSSEMLQSINHVPVHYTPESVYHREGIQYGETGHYWGKFQVKIHRSNFWFFGWPKKSQLIETLIHEFRHRASPWLGHTALFYEKVQRETQCALKNWNKL